MFIEMHKIRGNLCILPKIPDGYFKAFTDLAEGLEGDINLPFLNLCQFTTINPAQ